jgi:hypothetical protein
MARMHATNVLKRIARSELRVANHTSESHLSESRIDEKLHENPQLLPTERHCHGTNAVHKDVRCR